LSGRLLKLIPSVPEEVEPSADCLPLRATFAARRRARPTTAENPLLFVILGFGFMTIFPIILARDPSYHTRSTYPLKGGIHWIAAVQQFNLQ
jgi:hypothetical protein